MPTTRIKWLVYCDAGFGGEAETRFSGVNQSTEPPLNAYAFQRQGKNGGWRLKRYCELIKSSNLGCQERCQRLHTKWGHSRKLGLPLKTGKEENSSEIRR